MPIETQSETCLSNRYPSIDLRLRKPPEPSPAPIKEPPDSPENPDAPVREPDPDEPAQMLTRRQVIAKRIWRCL